MSKIKQRLVLLVPALLALAVLAAPFASGQRTDANPPCPICGGAWDDYVELVTTLVEFNVEFAYRALDS